MLRICCVKAFRDSDVNWLQQLQCFVCSVVTLPKRGKITGRAQLPAACLLTPGNLQALDVQSLGLIACVVGCQQQARLDTQYLGKAPMFAGLLRSQRGLDAALLGVSLGFQRQKEGQPQAGSSLLPCGCARVKQLDPVIKLALTDGGPSFENAAAGQPVRQAMRQPRETVEHPFGTMKARMGATHFLTKTLPKVAAEMALSVLAYNLTRVMNIVGTKPPMAATAA
ncbi:hypothetical protein V1289_004860 [Bradyrhizobium sp. AZCC 2289]